MTLTARSPRSGPGTLTAPAPAKINLTLNVLGPRPDGYHEIRSLVIGVDFADQITVTSAAPDVRALTSDDPSLPVDERNLIQQAATLLARQAGVRAGWRIALAKRIPIGGGLGGGSSDAATTLRLLNDLWACGCSSAELAALGAQLGSDVPLFFALPAAVIEGRGERVRPVKLAWSGWITLILGGWPVATRDVYQAWCAGAGAAPDPHAAEAAIVHAQAADQISPWLVNDLESAVMRVCPPMSSLQRSASALTSSSVRVSGAGSTLFALFDTQEQAQALADTVRARLGVPAAHVVRTLDHQTP
ncbi:MAG TPA: 4-(cytidine 5'-diphospho)-2-C-methyl-D-erythritol kinase [Phycisphaerae bacterium]|jgi:4-diphosphocytidyl-2-C-methyl-D-erythritol kinase